MDKEERKAELEEALKLKLEEDIREIEGFLKELREKPNIHENGSGI